MQFTSSLLVAGVGASAGWCTANSPAHACGPCDVESDCGNSQSGVYYCQAARDAACDSPGPAPGPAPSPGGGCVSQRVLTCINDYSGYWPKCDPSQSKSNTGPDGYEFGYYCTQEWVDALNSMLSSTQVNMCGNSEKIAELLGEVAWETGYFSTVYQPRDGGAGLIHMIPGNWGVNAADMDAVFGNHGYAGAAASMGKNFFQSSQYGWLSVAAWYKSTNRVVSGCGLDLFQQSYDTQSRCIFGSASDRSESLNVAKGCLQKFLSSNATLV